MVILSSGAAYPKWLFTFIFGEKIKDGLEHWLCESTCMKGHVTTPASLSAPDEEGRVLTLTYK